MWAEDAPAPSNSKRTDFLAPFLDRQCPAFMIAIPYKDNVTRNAEFFLQMIGERTV
jgi:hypothetical protein